MEVVGNPPTHGGWGVQLRASDLQPRNGPSLVLSFRSRNRRQICIEHRTKVVGWRLMDVVNESHLMHGGGLALVGAGNSIR